jgi:uncharacterized membrane protein
VTRFVCPLLPNPRPLGPLYTVPPVDLALVLLGSRPSNAHAIHVLLLLEYTLSLSFLTLFASRSPIAVQSLASLGLSDTPFYIPLVSAGRLSRRFFASFVSSLLVHVELFVVLLSSPFSSLFACLFSFSPLLSCVSIPRFFHSIPDIFVEALSFSVLPSCPFFHP